METLNPIIHRSGVSKRHFFIQMNESKYEDQLLYNLTAVAGEYKKLLQKEITLACDDFLINKEYKIRFYETNFLHLTGVKTNLSPLTFFEKCYYHEIKIEDIKNLDKIRKNLIKDKLSVLMDLSKFFNKNISAQENYSRNLISCAIATSDGVRTIGFCKAGPIYAPKTLLKRNKLNTDLPIYTVNPKIKYVDKNDSEKRIIHVEFDTNLSNKIEDIFYNEGFSLNGAIRQFLLRTLEDEMMPVIPVEDKEFMSLEEINQVIKETRNECKNPGHTNKE